jgi:chaperonin cofactor prefoldin
MKMNYNKSIKQMLSARDNILQEIDEIEETVNKASSYLDTQKNKDKTDIPFSEKLEQIKSCIDTLVEHKNIIDKKYEQMQENLQEKYKIYEKLAHNKIAVRSHSIKRKRKSASFTRRRSL